MRSIVSLAAFTLLFTSTLLAPSNASADETAFDAMHKNLVRTSHRTTSQQQDDKEAIKWTYKKNDDGSKTGTKAIKWTYKENDVAKKTGDKAIEWTYKENEAAKKTGDKAVEWTYRKGDKGDKGKRGGEKAVEWTYRKGNR